MAMSCRDDDIAALLTRATRLSLLPVNESHETEQRSTDLNDKSIAPALLVYAAQVWASTTPPELQTILDDFSERIANQYNQIADVEVRALLVARRWLVELIEKSPYLAPAHILLARTYVRLRYSDLAAGAAYKALLLLDAISDDSDENHESASQAFEEGVEAWDVLTPHTATKNDEASLKNHRTQVYTLLAQTLQGCGCLKTAYFYCTQGLELDPASNELQKTLQDIKDAAVLQYGESTPTTAHENAADWPDMGLVRRECYPWNTYEPNRLDDLDILNKMMEAVAPRLEVKAVRLPALASTTNDGQTTEVVQLGVFAREDISPDEIVLKETSLLTANNKLQDALCDACSVELPELGSARSADIVACDECQVVFCSQTCYDMASQSYHPALCDRDVEAIAKDVPLQEASDSLYSLLLLRSLAMAETQDCHPLDLQETKYIWGDFNDLSDVAVEPTTLPFSFKYNITLPFHMLEKMDIDIFANAKYDVWVFNTLYAKFRGTASARLSGLGGRAIRGPEVCAVHPMWCLANHSCDPNVSWEWGGEITFRTRKQRVQWHGSTKTHRNEAGVRKGEEVLNHYCDLDLPVQERREWARGALGGDCMCERCVWESQQLQIEQR
ncbi:hypothetical protein AMS68_002731 [Peltaster fructicola]|uniref:SET domain-containing protein n=1 Tax=Peltaster fructicola TaxID=286661 RepID=A0A6H0XR49_9PEZI|nr:hypothetical protein AMS68_002731 [Peltaster fructicola]